MSAVNAEERMRRWRLILGGGEADAIQCTLGDTDAALDRCLAMLYGSGAAGGSSGGGRQAKLRAGLGGSAPSVARWLGDIRQFFPSSVVRLMQKDAFDRLGLQQMLLEPEMLSAVEPDVHLVSTLISLKGVMPAKTKETARIVVNRVVEDVKRRLEQPTRQAVLGSLNRAVRNRRPRHNEIDWNRTIRANLKNYQRDRKTIIPETRIGYGRKRASLRDIVLCIDQSGSMAASVVYSGIFGAVLASLPAVSTSLIVFDTAIVDLTEQLHDDPVDLLFGVQLGGGTDINRAVSYCQGLIKRPEQTIMIIISDLCEGGNAQEMLKRVYSLVLSGVQVIALLALDDSGAPWFDHHHAGAFSAMGIPTFACTPDLFPEMLATAIARRSMAEWAAQNELVLQRGEG